MNELFRRALMLPPQASSISYRVDVLHYTVITGAFLVAFLAFVFIATFMIRFRERPDWRPPRHHPTYKLELGLGAFTLTVFIVWWCVGFSQFRDMHTVPKNAMRIHCVSKQWMWQFVYPNGAHTEDELRVPLGQPIEMLITSRDVLHSFFVPAFRIKQDAVPGRITEITFTAVEPGRFMIECAEYCGAGHSRMRGTVIVMQPGEWARWVSGQTTSDLAAAGEKLAAQHNCLGCHSIDGSRRIGPTWLGLYGAKVHLTNGQTVVADDAYLTESMMDPMGKIVEGFSPVMPSYLGTLSGPEAAAIVEYIHSLRRTP